MDLIKQLTRIADALEKDESGDCDSSVITGKTGVFLDGVKDALKDKIPSLPSS